MGLFDRFQPVLSEEDRARVVAAIRDAELGHRGEIRVHVERRCPAADPLRRAEHLFESLGMHATAGGTAALLYVATDDRVACVWAGAGLYEAERPGFWDEVVDEVAGGFVTGAPARGLCTAVRRIGKRLATLAPGEDVAGNELSDEISG